VEPVGCFPLPVLLDVLHLLAYNDDNLLNYLIESARRRNLATPLDTIFPKAAYGRKTPG
jgi:hypothetical protein